ncbi:MAG: hypothetical protein JRJ29_01515 [Deltaproteobacteria bacterium]|nr:hypothetical protein [Deltaproteobacteria bacterium]
MAYQADFRACGHFPFCFGCPHFGDYAESHFCFACVHGLELVVKANLTVKGGTNEY